MSTARKQKELRRSRKRSARIFLWSALFGFTGLILLLVVSGLMEPIKREPPAPPGMEAPGVAP